MRVDELDYDLPEERIARAPSPERSAARMLVVPPGAAPFEHATVAELAERVPSGALVVVNDTRVLRARLLGKKEGTGGRAEVLLVRNLEDGADGAETWEALGRASKGMREGTRVLVGDPPALAATVSASGGEGGVLRVELRALAGGSVAELVERVGHVPLPPYLRREDEAADRERYQTVYARVPGAVAAPTAGLHLTDAMLARLRERGVELARVTLHVGLGTFQPVTVDDLDRHAMHAEQLEVPEETARAVARARERGAPVVAIGTTTVRALESAAASDGSRVPHAMRGETRLLIQPGYRFRVVDALLTNFHLPRSTLLALVYAFGGRDRVRAAYTEAVLREYRFFSYGDAMWLPARAEAS